MRWGDLYEAFRSDVVDTAEPYLWTDSEVWRYMADAYRQFIGKIGGIADSTSHVTKLQLYAGQATSSIDLSIQKVVRARLVAADRILQIHHYTAPYQAAMTLALDNGFSSGRASDAYGYGGSAVSETKIGNTHVMILGRERGTVHWANIPHEDDVCELMVFRGALIVPSFANADIDSASDILEIDDDHHSALLYYMKSIAYNKQDAETFDRDRAAYNKVLFDQYCKEATADLARARSVNQPIQYGGI